LIELLKSPLPHSLHALCRSVLIDNTTGELISKDNKKRKVQSSLQKSSSLPVKRKRTTEPIIPRPQLGKDITLPQSSLPSSPKRSPLRTKLLRILAQEPLSLDQIQAKCGAKIPLAQTLQQVPHHSMCRFLADHNSRSIIARRWLI